MILTNTFFCLYITLFPRVYTCSRLHIYVASILIEKLMLSFRINAAIILDQIQIVGPVVTPVTLQEIRSDQTLRHIYYAANHFRQFLFPIITPALQQRSCHTGGIWMCELLCLFFMYSQYLRCLTHSLLRQAIRGLFYPKRVISV